MSIQWTFVAGFLYFEIAVVALMLLPIFHPRRWHQFFKSRLISMFRSNGVFYFYVFVAFLTMLLIDAIRDMKKYSHFNDAAQSNLASEMKGNVKLFRAQRNFYITGFSIFLTFVIRRLVTMLTIQYELTIKAQDIIKQAEATVNDAKSTIVDNTRKNNEMAEKLEQLEARLEVTAGELEAEQDKTKELLNEVNKWKVKYLETTAKHQNDSASY